MPATKKLTASRPPRLTCGGPGPAVPNDAVVTVIVAECPPRIPRENGVSTVFRGCVVRRRSAGKTGAVFPSLTTGHVRLRPGPLGAKQWRLFRRECGPVQRKPELFPHSDHRLGEFVDQRVVMMGRGSDAQPLAALGDRRIVDRLDVDRMPLEQEIACVLAKLGIADEYRHDV